MTTLDRGLGQLEATTLLVGGTIGASIFLVPADVAREVGSKVILRGLRAGFDFEQEFEMALMWRNLAPDIDVLCIMSALEHQFIYASRIKEVARLGADISNLAPRHIVEAIAEKINEENN